MDILYTERTDGFVIVSSDSDFTRLAIRLREAGQRVIGIGERKTPSAFIAACDKFTYIEVIRARAAESSQSNAEGALDSAESGQDSADSGQSNTESGQDNAETGQGNAEGGQSSAESGQKSQPQHREKQTAPQRPKYVKIPKKIIQLIADSVADLADESGVVFMGELGNLIMKKQPDFDNRNYGYKSLSAMIKSIDRFDIDFRQTTDPNIKHVFVRDKEAT
jgi:uncharacterized LabA/DUF88 family protein